MSESIKIDVEKGFVEGDLNIPINPVGIVIFAHGSGSSRHSSRNKFVAGYLNEKNIATLLFDLLTKEEDYFYENRFHIDLLAERLIKATEIIKSDERLKKLNIGYFGASTGAAAAITAAAQGKNIKAIVSRGGRPDMADVFLGKLQVPTLLIIGGDDTEVIKLNREAYNKINYPVKEFFIVPQATHLFEEPGALEEVAALAANWFLKYLI